MHSLNFSREGYDGTLFKDFYVTKAKDCGPGWFIFGRDTKKYGVNTEGKGNYVMLCGYRVEKKSRNYNGKVRHGWNTKKKASEVLAWYLDTHPQIER